MFTQTHNEVNTENMQKNESAIVDWFVFNGTFSTKGLYHAIEE